MARRQALGALKPEVKFGEVNISFDIFTVLPKARIQKIAEEESKTLREGILERVQRGVFFDSRRNDYSRREFFFGLNRRFYSHKRNSVWQSQIKPAGERYYSPKRLSRGGYAKKTSYKEFKSAVGITRDTDVGGGFRFKPQGGKRVDLFLTGQMLRDLRVKTHVNLPDLKSGQIKYMGKQGGPQRRVFELSYGVIFEAGFASKESQLIAQGFHDSTTRQYRPFAYFTEEDARSVGDTFRSRVSSDTRAYVRGGGHFVGRSDKKGFFRINF